MPNQLTEKDFLDFLAKALMYDEEPFAMNKPFSPLVYDSVGTLLLATAIESTYGNIISLDELTKCKTPGDIYDLFNSKN